MIPAVELQKAVYLKLSTKYKTLEVIPKEPVFPFLSLGQMDRIPSLTKTDPNRYIYSIYIHGWSKGLSSLEIKTMDNFTVETMQSLKVNGFDVELIKLELGTTITEKSGEENIFHFIQQYSITLNKKKE